MTAQNAAPLVRVSVAPIFDGIQEDSYPVSSIVSVPGPTNDLNPNGDQDEVFEVLQTSGGDPRALMRNRTGQALDLFARDGDNVLTFPATSDYQSIEILPPSPHSCSGYQTVELGEPMSLDLLGRQHLTLSFDFIARRLINRPSESPQHVVLGYIRAGAGRWSDAEIFLDGNQNVTDVQIIRDGDA